MAEHTLEEELAAARRTVEALIRRAEKERLAGDDRLVLLQAIAHLEDSVGARQEALTREEERFRKLFDAGPDMLVVLREGQIQERNRAAISARLRGSFAEIFDEAPPPIQDEPMEARLVLKDGVPVHVSVTPLGEGEHLAVLRDLSVQTLLEDELQRTRRLAALGELCSALAHEINNPLAVVMGRLELLSVLGLDLPDAAGRQLEVVTDHARRIAQIVQNLQIFGLPSRAHIEPQPLAKVLQKAMERGGRRLRKVEIITRLKPPTVHVHGDPGQLEQLFTALLVNSSDAMNRLGRIEIRARVSGDELLVDFHDQGSVPIGVRERLERPRADLGAETLGAAFGMAVAVTIVREHGGSLVVFEEGSGGTTYRLRLPRPSRSEATPLTAVILDPRGEPAQRVRRLLRDEGHRVAICGTSAEALAAVAELGPDLILAWPWVEHGSALARLVSAHPELERSIVLLLGQDEDTPVSGVPSLRPSFSKKELLAAVHEVTQGSSASSQTTS